MGVRGISENSICLLPLGDSLTFILPHAPTRLAGSSSRDRRIFRLAEPFRLVALDVTPSTIQPSSPGTLTGPHHCLHIKVTSLWVVQGLLGTGVLLGGLPVFKPQVLLTLIM